METIKIKKSLKFKNLNILKMELNVVYYIFINPERNWKTIIEGQLKDFKRCNIIFKKFYVFICCCQDDLIDECKMLINSFNFNNIDYTTSNINQYEYPGLKLLYDVSRTSNDIFLYFHSKGMVFNNNSDLRTDFEQTTLRATLFYWRRAMDIFKTIVNVNKVGLWPSHQGYIWVNFFYIRGGYLANPPELTTDRFYYETYIKNETFKNETFKNGSYLDCYSLIKDRVCWIDPDNIKDDRELILSIDQRFEI